MELNIRFKTQSPIICPHCGEIVDYKTIEEVNSGGRVWYDFLEDIGYYVPDEKQSNETPGKYGEDMALSTDQIKTLRKFLKTHNIYEHRDIDCMALKALVDEQSMIVNADWW